MYSPLLQNHIKHQSSSSFTMSSNDKITKNTNEQDEVSIPIYTALHDNQSDTKPEAFSQKSPEISQLNPTTNKPPKHPSSDSPLTRRKPLKAQTRFGEPLLELDSQTFENLVTSPQFFERSPSSTPGNAGVSGRFTKDKENKKDDGPDEKEIYLKITSQLSAQNIKRMTIKFLAQLFVFLVILSCLITSLTVKKFKGKSFLGVIVWKWFVFVMVIFSGFLITQWVVHLVVFLIEWKFLLKKNVVYFTHGLQNDVVVFIWFSVILSTWCILKADVKTVYNTKHVLKFITMTFVTFLIGSFLWLVKTTLMKILASSFHLNRFFERIQEAVFHHYVLQTLSGRPVVDMARKLSNEENDIGQVSFSEHADGKKEKKVVDWTKLHQMKKDKVPSWTMKLLVDVVSNSGLSTVSGQLSENVVEGGVELDDNEITSEEAAIANGVSIFYNVIGDKDEPYIERADLHRFMILEEVNLVYHFFEVNDKGQIDLKAFCKWVVKICKDRQALQHALNDNKTAVDDLNRILIAVLIIMMIIMWLLLTEIITSKLLVFFGSQLVVAAFIFGNSCKTTFEAIIFVFVMHPFDVGDRCIIDQQMMIVEEMNILTTVFLKADKEKVYYPNSVLATKSIGNYYRSPNQGDTLEFAIDYRTPLPKIAQLKERIKLYVQQNPQQWHPNHNLVVKEIENVNKIKMVLFFNHTINFQDYQEKLSRRSIFALELKNIFDSLEITYGLLPQEVVLSNVPSPTFT